MNILKINESFQKGFFQKAVVDYDSYIVKFPEMAARIYYIRNKSLQKLQKNLCDQAKKIRLSLAKNIEQQTNSPIQLDCRALCLTVEEETNIENFVWWRIDFFIDGPVEDTTGNINFVVQKNALNPICIKTIFKTGTAQSLIFACNGRSNLDNNSNGSDLIEGYAVAFSTYRLARHQVAEQICLYVEAKKKGNEEDILDTLLHINSRTHLIREYQDQYFYGDFNDFKSLYAEEKKFFSIVNASLDRITDGFHNLSRGFETTSLDNFEFSKIVESNNLVNTYLKFNIEGLKKLADVLILHGWIFDPGEQVCSIKLSNLSGNSPIEVFFKLIRYDRPDVVSHFSEQNPARFKPFGFAAVVNFSFLDEFAKSKDFTVHVATFNGVTHTQTVALSVLDSDLNGLMFALGVVPSQLVLEEHCRRYFKPIFDAYRASRIMPSEGFVQKYGPMRVCSEPTLSIIIPLYGSTRFELTQIPVLASLRQPNWEIIFGVDDPDILEEVKKNVTRLSALYDLPIKIVTPLINLGFAGINNFSIRYACSENILFLNSDCFLTDSDPINSGLSCLKIQDNVGAVGFRLLYSDQTIQHDGMAVSKWEHNNIFILNDHPRQGLPENLIPEHIVNDKASMLTGACLLITKKVFNDVSGFNCDYFKGDFEDSDLCLKIRSLGKKLAIVRRPGIYHLERQSISHLDLSLRERITLTNSLKYSDQWGGILSTDLLPLEVVA